MTARTPFSGVFAAAVTPLDATGAPDPQAAARYCARLLDDGCDGINLLGTTGEAASFSRAQRAAVMEAVADGCDAARCMAGTGASALDDALSLSRRALELGYGGVLVIPPFYYKGLSDDEVLAYYATLIERIGDDRMRLYLYHFPGLSGVPISATVVGELASRYPAILAGLKDSEGRPGYAEALARAHPDLAIFPSSETRLGDGRAAGFAGCISATVQITAPFARTVWSGAASEDPGLRAAADVLARAREVLTSFGTIPAVRHAAARLWSQASLARPAPPLSGLSPQAAAACDAALARIAPLALRFAESGAR